MIGNYMIIDVETSPIDIKSYEKCSPEDQLKCMNPIDSRIVATGIRYNGKNKIIMYDDEKKLLEEFWIEWKTLRKGDPKFSIVGFNIKEFDLSMLTCRSMINNVVISPFLLKSIIDIREKIHCYRFGPCKGKLKDFGKLIGEEILDFDGSNIATLWEAKEVDKIKTYLERDLEITDAIFKRLIDTAIVDIDRW